ncbi:MAG: late competence development ComFB family protein [Acidimicrobiia bacterium]
MRPHNYVEDHVFELADRLTAADAEFCGCEKCLTDVSAYALSQLKPAYASSEVGRAMTAAKIEAPAVHAEITAKVVEAIKAVKEHPRH